jgi:D-alanyl-D-alanine carboxypeptidase/D-alanyl-D-alanine-endopeptidase (penicillin-binding protein 4)
VSENLWALINQFARSKIQVIEGDLVVDESRFDQERISENRDPKRSDEPYDAPVGAMSFNWNSVNVFMRPSAIEQQSCEVFAEPESGYLRVENSCQTTLGNVSDVKVTRLQDPSGDLIQINGRMGLGHDEIVFFRNISAPAQWSGQNLIEFLKQRGIQLKGHIQNGIAPATAKIYATQTSRPLSLIAQDMAKVSNNFVAEMITKNIAAESGEQPASLGTGLHLIRNFLGEIGMDMNQIVFVSPSGFSRKNQISAFQLSKYLKLMQNDFSIFPEFLASLPVAGRDGTLKDRNKNSKHIGWIRAKTGTMDGVVGLSGFIGLSGGRTAVFSFMFNGPVDLEPDARLLFDALADEVANQ